MASIGTHSGPVTAEVLQDATASRAAAARASFMRASAAHAATVSLHNEYIAAAAAFVPLASDNAEEKMTAFNAALAPVYGDLPFAQLEWGTSILGTLVGLICAQTVRPPLTSPPRDSPPRVSSHPVTPHTQWPRLGCAESAPCCARDMHLHVYV